MRPILVSLLLVLFAPAALAVEAPEGYRMDQYRAPVPDSVPGGRTVAIDEVRALHADGAAVFIDVIPASRHDAGGTTTWTRPEPRENIPGSLWLPNVGRGAPEPAEDAWFRRHLEALAAERPGVPLLFYCMADCWMSWNAAKRAAAWGFGPVLWFPAGTDDWGSAGLPLVPGEPAPWP